MDSSKKLLTGSRGVGVKIRENLLTSLMDGPEAKANSSCILPNLLQIFLYVDSEWNV